MGKTRDWRLRRGWKTAGLCLGVLSGIYLSTVWMMDCSDGKIDYSVEYIPGIAVASMCGICYIVASEHAHQAKLLMTPSMIESRQIVGKRSFNSAICLCLKF